MVNPLILIAEDDPFLLKVYKLKVEKADINAVFAQDGEQVFTLLQQPDQQIPSLIMLDIIMPKKDGFSVLKELKETERWANIPVIITSNLGQPEDKVKAFNLGAIDYLVKSDTSINEIISRIQDVISALEVKAT